MRHQPFSAARGGTGLRHSGVAVDENAAESEVSHAAFQLVGRCQRVLQCDVGKAAIAAGAPRDVFGQMIVAEACQPYRRRRVALRLNARRDRREDRHLDPRLVHGRQTLFAEVAPLAVEHVPHRYRDVPVGGPPVVLQGGRHEVLLQSDLGQLAHIHLTGFGAFADVPLIRRRRLFRTTATVRPSLTRRGSVAP